MKDWQQIGDVARDITERLRERRVIELTVSYGAQEPRVFEVPVAVVEYAPLILKIEVKGGGASHEPQA